MLDLVAPSFVSSALTVIVMLLVVTVAAPELNVRAVPVPATRATTALTVADELNRKPVGALRIIVPAVLTSRVAPSVSTGPVNVVYDPPVVSAGILALAGVEMVAVANAEPVATRISPVANRVIASDFVIGFLAVVGYEEFWRRIGVRKLCGRPDEPGM
jgi:hypothetical protein